MVYRLANMRINSSTNCSKSCEKMVKIGSVFFQLKWGRKWKLSCKSAKIRLYCRISQQLKTQNWRLRSLLSHSETKCTIVLQMHALTARLIALSMQGYRLANTRINSSTNCSTSCEKMVKIGSVVFELKLAYIISTTTEPVFTNVSALVGVYMRIIKLT